MKYILSMVNNQIAVKQIFTASYSPLEGELVLSEDEFKKYENIRSYKIVEGELVFNSDKTLEDKKTLKIDIINLACDKAIVSGFTSEALGSKHFYYSTLEEQSTLNSLINLGVDNQFKAQKITLVDGVETKEARKAYPHTIQQLRDVLADGFTHIATQVAKKDALEIKINNATTVEELEAISWEA